MEIPHFEDSSNDHGTIFEIINAISVPSEFEKEKSQMQVSLRYLSRGSDSLHQALKELTSELTIQDLSSFRTYSHSVQSFLLEEYFSTISRFATW